MISPLAAMACCNQIFAAAVLKRLDNPFPLPSAKTLSFTLLIAQ